MTTEPLTRVWAPEASRVRLVAGGHPEPMNRQDGGWWCRPALQPGTDYAFLLDDSQQPLPDPASRWQPYGVHGASRVYDQDAYRWGDGGWRGRELEGGIVYELHLGTFTPGATFDSACERLDHLASLGVTHVELLPVNAFDGRWNWGYDGVDWYAVHEPYGGPDGLKRFVDACHARGLAVLLDVVYNHLGPSGAYLQRFGPYLKDGHNTWGELVNLEHPEVRRYILDNALMWLRDYHADGLRLDAVHALVDGSPTHIVAELSARVDALADEFGRTLALIAESDLNDPVTVTQRPDGYGLTAQWDDDVHHALHAALTGEHNAYYCDFGSMSVLAKVLTRAFLHDGGYSAFRGARWGNPVDRERVPGSRFVAFLQNHDQVGNRAAGERLGELTSPALVRVGAVLLLTAPFTPMLWMGEEWGASSRWPFFTSRPEPELGESPAQTRETEFARHGWDVSRMPNPQDPSTYSDAVLRWGEVAEPAHQELLEFYRTLIRLRAAEPELRDGDLTRVRVDYDDDERWLIVHRGTFRVVANFSDSGCRLPVPPGQVVLSTMPGVAWQADALAVPAQTAAIIRLA